MSNRDTMNKINNSTTDNSGIVKSKKKKSLEKKYGKYKNKDLVNEKLWGSDYKTDQMSIHPSLRKK